MSEALAVRLDPQALIAEAIKSGSGIETLERLAALAKDVQAQRAKEAWHAAMAEFQATCPPVKKTAQAAFTARGAQVRYGWAPLDEILGVVQPVLGQLGLSLKWRTRVEGQAIAAECIISHELGHAESSGEIVIPFAAGEGTAANAGQRIGIATTYARRYSCMVILGLAPEDDTDGQGLAEPQPPVQQPRAKDAPAAPPAGKLCILKVDDPKTGKRKDGSAWTSWTIHTSDGAEVTTFSATVAEIAQNLAGSGVEVELDTEQKGAYVNVRGITEAGTDA